MIGGLALALALGAANGSTTNQAGALSVIAGAPLGGAALAVLAVGLLGYAVWQIGQAMLGRGLEPAAGTDRPTGSAIWSAAPPTSASSRSP